MAERVAAGLQSSRHPVLFCALARLAEICFSVAMKALLLVGDLVGIVTLAPGVNVMKTWPICGLLGLRDDAAWAKTNSKRKHL
jgi:hypothetical protein